MSTCFLTTLQPNVCVLGDCMAASYKSDVHTKSHTMDWFVGMGGGIYLERMGRRGVLDLFFVFFRSRLNHGNPGLIIVMIYWRVVWRKFTGVL